MHFQVITIFPEFFESPLSVGLLDKAASRETVRIDVINLRDFAAGRHRQTDDVPYGGGPGMVLMPGPLHGAIEHARSQCPGAKVLALSPGGRVLDHELACELSQTEGVVLICGRYEGIDQRIIDHECDGEISIGDYVLTGGEPAALVIIDAVSRQIPGVVGDPESVSNDSHTKGLRSPQYTRPAQFLGKSVPKVLLGGDHSKITTWRNRAAWQRTRDKRPDLLPALFPQKTWLLITCKTAAVVEPIVHLMQHHSDLRAVFVCRDTATRETLRSAIEAAGIAATVKPAQGKALQHICKQTDTDPWQFNFVHPEAEEQLAGLRNRLAEDDAPLAITIAEDAINGVGAFLEALFRKG